MKTFLISLFAVFLSFGFAMQDAEAKRLGGSKSFGMQRTAPTKQEAAPAPTAAPKQTTAAPAPARSDRAPARPPARRGSR